MAKRKKRLSTSDEVSKFELTQEKLLRIHKAYLDKYFVFITPEEEALFNKLLNSLESYYIVAPREQILKAVKYILIKNYPINYIDVNSTDLIKEHFQSVDIDEDEYYGYGDKRHDLVILYFQEFHTVAGYHMDILRQYIEYREFYGKKTIVTSVKQSKELMEISFLKKVILYTNNTPISHSTKKIETNIKNSMPQKVTVFYEKLNDELEGKETDPFKGENIPSNAEATRIEKILNKTKRKNK